MRFSGRDRIIYQVFFLSFKYFTKSCNLSIPFILQFCRHWITRTALNKWTSKINQFYDIWIGFLIAEAISFTDTNLSVTYGLGLRPGCSIWIILGFSLQCCAPNMNPITNCSQAIERLQEKYSNRWGGCAKDYDLCGNQQEKVNCNRIDWFPRQN